MDRMRAPPNFWPTAHASSGTFAVFRASKGTNSHAGGGVPSQATSSNGICSRASWEAPALSVKTFGVPENWKAARIWGRRNCDFSRPGPNKCLTGGCNGGVECDRETGTGAKFTFDESPTQGDALSLSALLISVQLYVQLSLLTLCRISWPMLRMPLTGPPELKGPFDTSGFPVGCKSYSEVTGDPAACCTGSHSTAKTCPNNGVKYCNYIKNACPNSYVHAYDEPSGRALFTCPTGRRTDYSITFCP
ncbi:thaumatin [Ephemerocybe angulata]|uniref:Thaumatin n=1 Tax=Ephemerocybe angulata TaxID=980116 RepID=A0A8H6M447_9AGAR|nr:thaumatin [Tulosesus angulatus]